MGQPPRPRPTYPCPADLIVCPRCRLPLHNTHVGDGWSTHTCRNSHEGGTCGQHLFVASVAGGAALVMTLTREEAEALRDAHKDGKHVTPHRVMDELGAYRLVEDE